MTVRAENLRRRCRKVSSKLCLSVPLRSGLPAIAAWQMIPIIGSECGLRVKIAEQGLSGDY